MTKYDVQKEFGLRVRENRKRCGLTQENLAEVIDKSVDTISNVERGFLSTRIKTAADIARALDMPLSDLFYAPPTSQEDRDRECLLRDLNELVDHCSLRSLEAVIQVVSTIIELDDAHQTPQATTNLPDIIARNRGS